MCFTFDLFAFCVKAGHNCRSFVRTIDVLSDAKKVPLCKFGIDFAFYNLARHCLALLGSCLNIFGLKTGRGEQAWSGGRIPIGFISLQRVTQGVALAGTGQTFTIILLDKASAAPEHSKIFFSGLHFAWRLLQIPAVLILHPPRISQHSRIGSHLPPQAPWRGPIMHGADRLKQQVGLPALKWFPGVLICRGLYSGVHNIDITPMYGIPGYIPTHTITIQPAKPTMHESCRAGLRIQTSNALWRYLAIIPGYRQFFSDICTFFHAWCAQYGRQATMHLE